jgi:hypothetical protein
MKPSLFISLQSAAADLALYGRAFAWDRPSLRLTAGSSRVRCGNAMAPALLIAGAMRPLALAIFPQKRPDRGRDHWA